jgi:CRISPR system Cascade subunit CasE
MYLSRVELNTNLLATKRALSSPQVIHAAVEGSFPTDKKARTLWRIDRREKSFYLLAVSRHEPDFRHIIEQFGWPSSNQQGEIRGYEPFLQRVAVGQKWGFRLRANPTFSEPVGPGKRGKVCPYGTPHQQEQWLKKRALTHGFKLLHATVTQREIRVFSKKRDEQGSENGEGAVKDRDKDKDKVTLAMATFEGALRVGDPELLTKALCNGIGRAKAYGCGLLTLAKI